MTQKRVIEQLEKDLKATQKAYEFGERYITRTLQRERQLRDELRAIMREKEGDITLINSLIFFLIILVVQSANVYTAMSLKNEKLQKQTAEISEVSMPEIKSFHEVSVETFPETLETPETFTETFTETSDEKRKVSDGKGEKVSVVSGTQKHGNEETETVKLIDEDAKKVIVASLKKRRNEGVKLEHLAETIGVSKSTLSKVLAYPAYPVSDEILKKISEKL
jgi:lambda repressor-like predicted transcriptional regulator